MVLKEAREVLEAHLNPIALPDVEKLPVLGSPDMFGRAWSMDSVGRSWPGTPLPGPGMVGQKLFADHFTLQVDRSCDAFFQPFLTRRSLGGRYSAAH